VFGLKKDYFVFCGSKAMETLGTLQKLQVQRLKHLFKKKGNIL